MDQGTILNQTRIPVKRGQVQPGPVVQASGVSVAALEAALDAALLVIADHESRIAALEP